MNSEDEESEHRFVQKRVKIKKRKNRVAANKTDQKVEKVYLKQNSLI